MNHKITLFIVAALLATPITTFAGSGQQELVSNVMYALIVDEKCKGHDDDDPDYMKRLNSYWESHGISSEDIQLGMLSGMRAEEEYPEGRKPRKTECKKAAKLKREVIDPMASQ